MIKEARGFGATIEEAKENAIKELNASDFEDVQFELITMPKKKVLGLFGGCKAEVKAFVEVPDKKVKSAKKAVAKNQPSKEVKNEKPKKAEKKAETPNTEKQETKTSEKETAVYSEPVDAKDIDSQSPAGKAVAYINTVISALHCEGVTVKVATKVNGALILLDGDDLKIGRAHV